MNNRLFTISALCLLVAALIFSGCNSGPAPTPTPAANDTPGVNVTQADYDAALARWKALNVQEYNMEVEYIAFSLYAGTWDLRVTSSDIEPTAYERGGTPTTLPTTNGQDLRLLTVDGLFNNVARALQDQSQQDYQFRYETRFDPEKGYPTFFSARSVPNPNTGGGQIADADYTVTVKSLTIVK